MKVFKGIVGLMGVALLASCVEHEVIPPPKEEVDLTCSFSATIEENDYELIQDVNGYFCNPSQAKEILPSPQPSSVKYYSEIRSDAQMDFLKIGLGSLSFNAEEDIDPTVEQFTAFFNSNNLPVYDEDAEEGIEIVFRDGQGTVWTSMDTTQEVQNFEFTSLVQESDEEGDYMKFTATFDVSLFDDLEQPTDTLVMENAVYSGYFER
ncbi:MAG: hypothetical protein ACQERC_03990 [Bacteroidota bacterium]